MAAHRVPLGHARAAGRCQHTQLPAGLSFVAQTTRTWKRPNVSVTATSFTSRKLLDELQLYAHLKCDLYINRFILRFKVLLEKVSFLFFFFFFSNGSTVMLNKFQNFLSEKNATILDSVTLHLITTKWLSFRKNQELSVQLWYAFANAMSPNY